MKIGIMIPTIRNELFREWIDAWKPQFDKYKKDITLYVMEDHATKEIKIPRQKYKVKHFCWKDIEKWEAEGRGRKGIIPRQCDSVRSFGFLQAYNDGMQYFITLDDDCFPTEEDLITRYLAGFLNVYNTGYYDVGLEFVIPTTYVRGYPFELRDQENPVMIQYGGWDNVPDLDATTQFKLGDDAEGFGFKRAYNVVPKYQAFTGCIMNCCWRREATPLMYQLLMGKNHTYTRWGDIWSGLIAKRCCDELNWSIAINGFACVEHKRASDPEVNFKQELSGFMVNEELWETLLRIDTWGSEPKVVYRSIAYNLNTHSKDKGIRDIGAAMQKWGDLFE